MIAGAQLLGGQLEPHVELKVDGYAGVCSVCVTEVLESVFLQQQIYCRHNTTVSSGVFDNKNVKRRHSSVSAAILRKLRRCIQCLRLRSEMRRFFIDALWRRLKNTRCPSSVVA